MQKTHSIFFRLKQLWKAGWCVLLFFPSIASAQTTADREDKEVADSLNLFYKTHQNHYLLVGYNYMLNPVGKTIGAQGTIASIGFNVARFLSKQITIGIVADAKFVPGISTKKLSKEFITDFNNAFIPTYSNVQDSANAYVIKAAVNSDVAQITGNSVFNIGLMVSLFPQKYGGLLLQVKYGSRGFQVHGVYGNPYVNQGGNDKVPMGVVSNWTCELTFKPYAFFENAYIDTENYSAYDIGKTISLSIFYERLNFQSANFNGTNFSQMVNTSFMDKYGIDNRFGFKVGFMFY